MTKEEFYHELIKITALIKNRFSYTRSKTLFCLTLENTWIHDDLKQILEQDFQTQSPAFKSKAKHILHRMKKIPKSKL